MRRLLGLTLLFVLALAQAFPKEAIPFEGKTLDGGYFKLTEYLGKKPIFLNFWATHCPPCLMEGPELEAYHQRYGDRIAFVAVDVQDHPKMASFRVREWGWRFPVPLDPRGKIAHLYGVHKLPTSFFIDSSGRVVRMHLGMLVIRDRTGELVADFLEKYLKELLSPP